MPTLVTMVCGLPVRQMKSAPCSTARAAFSGVARRPGGTRSLGSRFTPTGRPTSAFRSRQVCPFPGSPGSPRIVGSSQS